jgi:hypothetical protein
LINYSPSCMLGTFGSDPFLSPFFYMHTPETLEFINTDAHTNTNKNITFELLKFMSRPYFLFSIRIHVRCRHRSEYLLPQTKFNVSVIFFDNQLLMGLISFKLLFQRNMKNKKNGQNDINGIFFLILLRFFLCI